jgi:transposase
MAVGNRCHIHAAVKEQLVIMSAFMRPREIGHVMGISKRTVNRVLSLSRRTGSVVQKPIQEGRPRALNALDIAVSPLSVVLIVALHILCQYLEGCIERTPDIYLIELQEELLEARGIDVSTATIRNTLCRRGFTRKRVSIWSLSQYDLILV